MYNNTKLISEKPKYKANKWEYAIKVNYPEESNARIY